MIETVKLGDMIEFQRGYDLPKSKVIPGPYPVETASEISAYHNNYKAENTIILGRSGTVGNPRLIRGKFWPLNTTLYATSLKGNDVVYMYYLLQNLHVEKMVTGSTVPTLNRNDLYPLTIKAETDVAIQKKIGRVLESIDQKTNNNNVISSQLESLAKTIYDYWFLQFDFPDENGRPYKSSGGKMVWNEELKREIPEGWKVDKAGNYISLIRGVAYKPSDEKNSAVKNIVPLLKSNNIQNGKINFDSPVYLLAEKIRPEQFLKDHSVFITMSSGSKAHMGKTAILYKSLPYAFGAFCGRISINPKYRSFLSMYFVSDMFRKYIESVTSGTSINNISSEQLASIIIAFPPEKVLNKFEEILNPIFSKQGDIVMENYQLSSLRDFLLPMLMNGQVTFKEDA